MSNGFSVEDMLERIEDRLSKIETKLDHVIQNGCAHREGDTKRIDKLEDWRDRSVFGIIALGVGLLVEFFRGH